jgi:hypothetical protein
MEGAMFDKLIISAGIVAIWVAATIWYTWTITADAKRRSPRTWTVGVFVVGAGAAIGGLIAVAISGCTPTQRQDARSALELASLICQQAETVTKCLDRVVPVDAPPPAAAPASCQIGDAGAPKSRDY